MAVLGYTTGLIGRFRASSLAGSLAEGDAVASWPNEGSAGGNATQGTPGYKPIFREAPSGRCAVEFDATDDRMATGITISAQPFSIFVVYTRFANQASGGAVATGVYRVINGSNNWLIGSYNGKAQSYNGTGFIDSASTLMLPGRFMVQGLVVDGAGAKQYVDNVLAGSNAGTGAPGVVGLGAQGAFADVMSAYLHEVLIFDHAVDSTARATIQSYMEAEYRPAETYYTSFSGETAATLPADWAYALGASGTGVIVDDVTATDGKLLRLTAGSDAYHGLLYKGIQPSSDFDILTRVRYASAIINYTLCGDGLASGAYWGVGAEGYSDNTTTAPLRNAWRRNVALTNATGVPTVPGGTWFWRRVQWRSGTLKIKVWTGAVGDEPIDFNVSMSDTGSCGYGGIGVVGAAKYLDLDIFAIGTNGSDAPTSPPNVAPTDPSFDSPAADATIPGDQTIAWTKGTDPDVGDTVTTEGEYQIDGGGWTAWFTGEAGTSRALPGIADCALDVRLRSSDGKDTSGWVYRSFTVQNNVAPGAPTITAPEDGSTVGATFTLAVTTGADPDVGQTLTDYYRTTLNGGAPSGWAAISGSASIGPFADGSLFIEAKTNDGTDDGPTDSVTVTVAGPPAGPSVTQVDVHFNFATIVGSAYSGAATQAARRFRVYLDDGTTLVWDSGWVTAPVTTYPDAPLAPLSCYYATVQDKDALGQETAESAQFAFETLAYPDVQVTQAGLAVVVADATPEARVTQVVAEAALQKTGLAEARVTQVILETILPHDQVAFIGSPCSLLLEQYKRDRTTVDWSVSTLQGAPNSYLRDPIQDGSAYAAQECDMAQGRASISSVKVCVIDKAFPGGDQQDRWLTRLLADPVTGKGAIMGRRQRLRRFIDPVRGWVTVADGPASAPRLRQSYSGYEWEIRDCRDNERRLPAFQKCTDRTVLPLGTLNGWGHLPDGSHLVPAAVPIVGTTFGADGGYNCGIDFSALWSGGTAPVALEITDAFREAVKATPPAGAAGGDPMAGTYTVDIFWRFPNIEVWWRAAGTNDPWNIVNPNERIGNIPPLGQGDWTEPSLVTTDSATIGTTGRTGDALKTVFLTDLHGGNSVPLANGQSLEVLFVYVGKPTEANPLLIDGLTAGQLLKKLYDGEYTLDENGAPTPTGILYDSVALLKMTTPVVAYITEPCDDLRDWAEKQVYAPTGFAPTFDNQLRISPLSQVPPATTAGLADLTNAITAPAPSWQHGDRVINAIRFTYRRFYGDSTAKAGFGIREITEEYRQEESINAQDEKPLEIDTVVFGAIGTGAGVATGPEVGAALAKLRNDVLIPRYAWGTPTATLRCFRSATYALRPGNFALAHPTWMPHYPTGQRGMSALVQVLEARDLSCAWREFVVEVVSDAAELPESLETRKGFIWPGAGGGIAITGTQGA